MKLVNPDADTIREQSKQLQGFIAKLKRNEGGERMNERLLKKTYSKKNKMVSVSALCDFFTFIIRN